MAAAMLCFFLHLLLHVVEAPNPLATARCMQVRVQLHATSRRTRALLQPTALLQARRMMAATAARSATQSCSAQQQSRQLLKISPCINTPSRRPRLCRPAALPPLAMINVDFASPSLVLGIALIGCGVALLQVRCHDKHLPVLQAPNLLCCCISHKLVLCACSEVWLFPAVSPLRDSGMP